VIILRPKVASKLKKHHLEKKFAKQVKLLEKNSQYPGLHVELLEPRQYGIYSFRIDRKFRALFFFRPDKKVIEILSITVHYQ